MKQPQIISEVMHQLVLNSPKDPYAQILRRCPFIQAQMLQKGYMSLDELSGEELDTLIEYQFLEDWTDNVEVCYKLHISARTLQRWRSEGLVAFTKIGNKIWYLKKDIEALLKSNVRTSTKTHRHGKRTK